MTTGSRERGWKAMAKTLEEKLNEIGLWLNSARLRNNDSGTHLERCPKCQGSGWEIYQKRTPWGAMNDYARKCECGAYAESVIQSRLEFAQIPEKYKISSIDNFDCGRYTDPGNAKAAKGILGIISKWLDGFSSGMEARGKGLYLYSKTRGSGKTRMAAAIANEFARNKNKSVRFATSQKILDEIRATWDKESAVTERELARELIKTDLLIVDDFGTGFGTGEQKDWINHKFFGIVNDRYMGDKVTVFTSNEEIGKLNCDERIKSRIREMAFEIPFPEEDVRVRIAKKDMEEMMGAV